MTNNHTKQYHVFLSHSSSDKAHVERIAVRLEDEAGLKPFLDKWHLVPGEPWQEALEGALDDSENCAVFLGPMGLGPWENEEMRSALDERVKDKALRVIPVLLPGANPKDNKSLPRFLRRLTWVDFRAGIDEHEAFNRLVAGIQGKKPGRQSSSNSKQEKKVQWVLVLSATIEDIDKARAEAIAVHLRQLSGDMTLTIQKIEAGSIKLEIESSEFAYRRIESYFNSGQLRDLLGMKVLQMQPPSEINLEIMPPDPVDSEPQRVNMEEQESNPLLVAHSELAGRFNQAFEEEADFVLEKEKLELLRELVQLLPEQTRRSITLRVVHDLSYQEIADQMGIALGTVKAHMRQAQKALKEGLASLKSVTRNSH